DHAFGYLLSAIAIISVIAPLLSKKFLKVSKEKSFIIISLVFAALFSFMIFTTTTLALALLVYLGVFFFMDLKVPAQRMFFHKFVPSNQRASIASVEAMIGHLFTAIAFPIAGYLTDHFSARYTIFISGIFIVVAIIIYLNIREET
ncbi:MAG: MFS transporter, partial [Nanoarchaeota archaeon]